MGRAVLHTAYRYMPKIALDRSDLEQVRITSEQENEKMKRRWTDTLKSRVFWCRFGEGVILCPKRQKAYVTYQITVL